MPKRKVLGCSFPVFILVIVVLLAMFLVAFLGGALGSKIFPGVNLPSWITVAEPHVMLPTEEVFTIFGFPIYNGVVGAWVTMLVLIITSWLITRRMKLVPGRVQLIFESLLGWIYDLCTKVAGDNKARTFFPVVITIFLFVLFNAWLSLIPGFGTITIENAHHHTVHLFRGANTDFNMPLALAVVSFFSVWFFGFKALGLRYLTKFFNFGPFLKGLGQLFTGKVKQGISGMVMGFMSIFVGMLELLSEFIRIVSFTFRLFGNMTAGEILLLVMAFLIPWFVSDIFYALELLVGFVQALIFAGLTLVFLTLATMEHGHE